MIGLRILLDGSGGFPEMQDAKIHEPGPESMAITALPGGLQSGRTSIAFIVQLEDGSFVFAENTMANFIRAAVAFHARYEDEWRAQGVELKVNVSAEERAVADAALDVLLGKRR